MNSTYLFKKILMWPQNMKQRQVNKASFGMVFIYHPILTNTHKRYVLKLLTKNVFSFNIYKKQG